MTEATEEDEGEDATDRDSGRSQYREKMIEHVFVAEMWKEAWFRRDQVLEVLRSEVDASGFDLLLECNGVQRHVQLKSTQAGGRARRQKVNRALETRTGGCVVWVIFDGDAASGLTSLRYRFFGAKPGEPTPSLGDEMARHTKANLSGVKGERPSIRILRWGRFQDVPSTEALFSKLFGNSWEA